MWNNFTDKIDLELTLLLSNLVVLGKSQRLVLQLRRWLNVDWTAYDARKPKHQAGYVQATASLSLDPMT